MVGAEGRRRQAWLGLEFDSTCGYPGEGPPDEAAEALAQLAKLAPLVSEEAARRRSHEPR